MLTFSFVPFFCEVPGNFVLTFSFEKKNLRPIKNQSEKKCLCLTHRAKTNTPATSSKARGAARSGSSRRRRQRPATPRRRRGDAEIGAAFEKDVTLAFIDDGVYQLLQNQDSSAIATKNFAPTFRALGDYDVNKIYVERESLEMRGLSKDDLMPLTWEDEDDDW